MKRIAAISDLDEARAQSRALVFLWVNWAIHARKSLHKVRELTLHCEKIRPELVAPIYSADLSDQQGEIWDAVRNWIEAEGRPVDHLTFSGVGPLLWLRFGRILAHVPFAGHYELDQLLAVTSGVFGAE
ncbi:unnamed protein product [Gemmata massiliana]|uniref:Uncharacterized protein n=1 Tax=Gemmata massiliana TaxID=1210884 RepID=A0A6P2DF40_9BACT|nr:unnamed protein product [Gemmata massiliana]